jgi:hypothetical protein
MPLSTKNERRQMNDSAYPNLAKSALKGLCSILGGVFLLMVLLLAVRADPIDPPEGYPKLSLSVKTVTPTLAATGGVTLT